MQILQSLYNTLSPLNYASKKLTENSVNLQEAENIVSFMLSNLKSNNVSQEFIDCLQNRIDARRNKAIISAINYFSEYEESEHFDYLNRSELIDFLQLFYNNHYRDDSAEEIVEIEVPNEKSQSNSAHDQYEVFLKNKKKPKKPKIDVDLHTLVAQYDSSGKIDPIIEMMINDLKSIQPTSVLTERTFSICGDLSRLRRNRMSFELLDSLVVLKYLK